MQQGRIPDPVPLTEGPGGTSSGRAARIDSRAAALDLAAWLQSPHRTQPAAVITSGPGSGHPIDADALASEFARRAEVYVLTGSDAIAGLNRPLPESWRLLREAARVFPTDGAAPHPTVAASPHAAEALREGLDRAIDPTAPLDRWPPAVEPYRITSAAQGREVAAHLRDPLRTRPFVLISTHPEAPAPFIDADDVVVEVSGLLPVVVLDAVAVVGLTAGLGDRMLSVSYGAGRVYPVGQAWLSDPDQAPLIVCATAGSGPRAAERLVQHALTAAHRAGLLRPGMDLTDQRMPVRAMVEGQSSDHHWLVRTEQGQTAILQVARLRVDVAPERLLRTGQWLTGVLSGHGRLPEFIPQSPATGAAELVRRECPDGATFPARVSDVAGEWALVELHPEFPVVLADEGDDLTSLLAPGDVVAVEVAWIDGQCVVALGDDRRAFAAPALLPGGPPWLLLDEAEAAVAGLPASSAKASGPSGPGTPGAAASGAVGAAAAAPGTAAGGTGEAPTADDALADARAAVELHAARAEALQAEAERLRREAKALRRELRKARTERKQRSLPEVYADPEAQFRWEVATTYLTTVADAEREQSHLAEYVLGRSFLGRLDALPGIPRQQILDSVVGVLTDRAAGLPGRAPDAWLARGSDQQQVRHDGATAWRVPVRVHSARARHLKYWRLPDGRIELDSVGVADGRR